jgi:hypothetical protein
VNGRSVAWLAYVPVPGLFLVPLWGARGDRLARFHAIQGGVASLTVLVLLALCGLYAYARSGTSAAAVDAQLLSAAVLLAGLAYLAAGAVAAGRSRFLRLRPFWDAAAPWLNA